MTIESTALELTPEIKLLIDSALEMNHPMLLAVVDAAGQPHLSFRGSARVFSDRQIGLWIRNHGGNTLAAVDHNPKVAMIYRSDAVPFLQFHGSARVTDLAAERERIFDLSPERERAADPERQGIAVLIDLTRVEGILGFVDGAPRFVRLGQ